MSEIKDLKEKAENKTANISKTTPTEKVEKKSISDEFLEELLEEEQEIFLQLKSILIDTCELLEFEAVTEDSLEDFVALITYIKNGVISIEPDGILVNLRRDILNSDKVKITDKVKILFERNESREKVFTKNIKVSKKNIESQKEFTRAALTASFQNVDVGGISKVLSIENTRKIHLKDYMLLLTIYNFFRN